MTCKKCKECGGNLFQRNCAGCGKEFTTRYPKSFFCSLDCRFWDSVDKEGHPKGCWIWKKYKSKYGYGKVGVENRDVVAAHRVSYELTYGPIPEGLFILHSCDNPPCVNPTHLRAGTPQQNVDDMISRNRMVIGDHSGENNANAILNSDDVISIINSKEPAKILAIKHGVAKRTIYDIRRGRSWKKLQKNRHEFW